jgi:hypothetical protein
MKARSVGCFCSVLTICIFVLQILQSAVSAERKTMSSEETYCVLSFPGYHLSLRAPYPIFHPR